MSGEIQFTADRTCVGKMKERPVTAHIAINSTVQMPTARCSSQIRRLQLRWAFTVNPSRKFDVPGHQITSPVRHRTSTQPAPMPLTTRPVLPPKRS